MWLCALVRCIHLWVGGWIQSPGSLSPNLTEAGQHFGNRGGKYLAITTQAQTRTWLRLASLERRNGCCYRSRPFSIRNVTHPFSPAMLPVPLSNSSILWLSPASAVPSYTGLGLVEFAFTGMLPRLEGITHKERLERKLFLWSIGG